MGILAYLFLLFWIMMCGSTDSNTAGIRLRLERIEKALKDTEK